MCVRASRSAICRSCGAYGRLYILGLNENIFASAYGTITKADGGGRPPPAPHNPQPTQFLDFRFEKHSPFTTVTHTCLTLPHHYHHPGTHTYTHTHPAMCAACSGVSCVKCHNVVSHILFKCLGFRGTGVVPARPSQQTIREELQVSRRVVCCCGPNPH